MSANMPNKGDDCYFYFYSTCTKGDSCAFRHCEAAVGNETVCTLWQEGRCFRQVCKFRHMEIDKKRSEIPCYWENQPSGCQKANCAFHHTKGRLVDGVFMPPNKSYPLNTGTSEEEAPVPLLPLPSNKLPVAPTPQLYGVKKMDANENVPSPTHPPVVINAADDDEDDDDQFSEEGEEIKNSGQHHLSPSTHQGARVIATRKTATPKKDANLNFGIKTLKEIRSKKQKINEVAKIDIIQAPTFLGPSQKQLMPEKDLSIVRTVTLSNKNELPSIHLSLTQRLGKRKTSVNHDSPLAVCDGESLPPVKKSLSQRLGKKPTETIGASDVSPKKVQIPRPLKERLGLPAEQSSAETEKAAKPAAEFRIKTLQEIQQEKAKQRQEADPATSDPTSEQPPNVKRIATSRPQSNLRIKTFAEIQAEKRHRQLKEMMQKIEGQGAEATNIANHVDLKQVADQVEIIRRLGSQTKQVKQNIRLQKGIKQDIESETVIADSNKPPLQISPLCVDDSMDKEKTQPLEKVRIKTLEEIRREKALRLKQVTESQIEETVSQAQVPVIRKKVLRISKPTVKSETKSEKTSTELRSSDSQDIVGRDSAMDTFKSTAKASASILINPPPTIPLKLSPKKQEEVSSTVMETEPAVKTSSVATLQDQEDQASAKVVTSTVQAPEKKAKGKPRVNVEPRVVKNRPPTKRTVKRKAKDTLAVVAVKPLVPVVNMQTSNNESSIPAEDSHVPEEAVDTEVTPKRLKESVEPSQELVSPSTTQAPVKSRRISTSAAKPTLSAEDDFDKLIWEISEGKLEAEIDLDTGKDEDDLLLELSEMIDS
ncbi:zinc finger CCCH domain-containing protein 11A-like isoform 2-T2 [Discoglossus pictus]